jgi:hypothetical protein
MGQFASLKSSPRCKITSKSRSGTKMTPAYNAKTCLGLVRRGQSAGTGKKYTNAGVYVALRGVQRNASYARSGGRRAVPRSVHLTAKWHKLYMHPHDKKPLRLSDLPRGLEQQLR